MITVLCSEISGSICVALIVSACMLAELARRSSVADVSGKAGIYMGLTTGAGPVIVPGAGSLMSGE
ncbi:hypothetical protein D3C84_1134300 [compost metagenome]